MRYIKTLNIWDSGIQEAIQSGQIKLQRGAWLRCGSQGKRCRYVSHTKNTIHVVHWQGTSTATRERFEMCIDTLKSNKAQQVALKAKQNARRTLAKITDLLPRAMYQHGYPLAFSIDEGFNISTAPVKAIIELYNTNKINIIGVMAQLKELSLKSIYA